MYVLQAVIIDDERYAREELLYLLEPYGDIDVVAEVARGDEAITKLRLRAIQTDRRSTETHPMRKLAVEVNDSIVYIDVDEIAYLYPKGKTSVVVTKDEHYVYKSSLKEAEDRLQAFSFFRTHRSFLVNLSYVERMVPWFNGAYELKLRGIEENISVSRNYAKAFMERMHI